MKRRQRKWVRCGSTYILMELWDNYPLPEWRIVGYVMKRKIYDHLPAQWQAWWTEPQGAVLAPQILGAWRLKGGLKTAKHMLEFALDEKRGYLEQITEPA